MTGSPPLWLILGSLALLLLIAQGLVGMRRRADRRGSGTLASWVAGQAELLTTVVRMARSEQIIGGDAVAALRVAAEGYARELSATLDALAIEIRAGIAAAPAPARQSTLMVLRDEGLALRALLLAGAAGKAARALVGALPSGEIDAPLDSLRAAVAEMVGLAQLVA